MDVVIDVNLKLHLSGPLDNSPYLEVHHIKPLSEGGLGYPENVIALCPNLNRNLHFGQLGRD